MPKVYFVFNGDNPCARHSYSSTLHATARVESSPAIMASMSCSWTLIALLLGLGEADEEVVELSLERRAELGEGGGDAEAVEGEDWGPVVRFESILRVIAQRASQREQDHPILANSLETTRKWRSPYSLSPPIMIRCITNSTECSLTTLT